MDHPPQKKGDTAGRRRRRKDPLFLPSSAQATTGKGDNNHKTKNNKTRQEGGNNKRRNRQTHRSWCGTVSCVVFIFFLIVLVVVWWRGLVVIQVITVPPPRTPRQHHSDWLSQSTFSSLSRQQYQKLGGPPNRRHNTSRTSPQNFTDYVLDPDLYQQWRTELMTSISSFYPQLPPTISSEADLGWQVYTWCLRRRKSSGQSTRKRNQIHVLPPQAASEELEPGLWLAKTFKTASTTAAAITLRLAHRVAQRQVLAHNRPQQEEQSQAISDPEWTCPHAFYHEQSLENIFAASRPKNSTKGPQLQSTSSKTVAATPFLWTIVRRPDQRALSAYEYYMLQILRLGNVSENGQPTTQFNQFHIFSAYMELTKDQLVQQLRPDRDALYETFGILLQHRRYTPPQPKVSWSERRWVRQWKNEENNRTNSSNKTMDAFDELHHHQHHHILNDPNVMVDNYEVAMLDEIPAQAVGKLLDYRRRPSPQSSKAVTSIQNDTASSSLKVPSSPVSFIRDTVAHYDFVAVSERMDESVLVLLVLLGILPHRRGTQDIVDGTADSSRTIWLGLEETEFDARLSDAIVLSSKTHRSSPFLHNWVTQVQSKERTTRLKTLVDVGILNERDRNRIRLSHDNCIPRNTRQGSKQSAGTSRQWISDWLHPKNNKDPNSAHIVNRQEEYMKSNYVPDNLDFLLYDYVNATLDRTIDSLVGQRRMSLWLQRYRTLQAEAVSHCQATAQFPCAFYQPNSSSSSSLGDGGLKKTNNSNKKGAKKDCYFRDMGCGYPCLDKLFPIG